MELIFSFASIEPAFCCSCTASAFVFAAAGSAVLPTLSVIAGSSSIVTSSFPDQ